MTVAPAAAQQIKKGGTVVVALTSEFSNLMQGLGSEVEKIPVTGQMYDTLIDLGPDFKIRPLLAESWDISPDGKTITFHLRKGVKWHDGKPFTSEDVAFSVLEVNGKFNPQGIQAANAIASIDTTDPLTAVVHLKTADPATFPWAFSQGNYAQIYPKHIFAGSDIRTNPATFKPIGTGPFIFKEWVHGDHITVERNPNYFLADQVYLDRVVFQIMPESGARQVALERGDIDYIPYFALPPSGVEPLAANKNIVVQNSLTPSLGQIDIWINLRNGPLGSKEVRQAIAYALDRKKIVELAMNGRANPGTSAIRSDSEFYNPDVPKYPHDEAKANSMLDAAGFPRKAGGVRFSIRLAFAASGEGGALDSAAAIIREELRQVGIDVQLTPADAAAWSAQGVAWNFDLTMGSYGTGPDPKIGVSRFYTTDNIRKGAWGNVMGYSNPKVDDLLGKADTEMDHAKRVKYYQDAQAIIADELPGIWLWEKFYPLATRKGLVGLPSGALHGEGFRNVGWTQ